MQPVSLNLSPTVLQVNILLLWEASLTSVAATLPLLMYEGPPEADLETRICVQVIFYGSALRRKRRGDGACRLGKGRVAGQVPHGVPQPHPSGELWSVSYFSAFLLPWGTGPRLLYPQGSELLAKCCSGEVESWPLGTFCAYGQSGSKHPKSSSKQDHRYKLLQAESHWS